MTDYVFVPAYFCSSGSDPGQHGWTHTVQLQTSPGSWTELETWDSNDLGEPETDRRKARAVLAHLTGREPERWVVDALVTRAGSSLCRLEVPDLKEWLSRLSAQGRLAL
ncbi:MAG TPA: hypothetical protein VH208_01920 [Myxococcaceae bacterium]|jgi:hypothetical protein|nr:hypothetical protein [Myxococcaceae bacterium]